MGTYCGVSEQTPSQLSSSVDGARTALSQWHFRMARPHRFLMSVTWWLYQVMLRRISLEIPGLLPQQDESKHPPGSVPRAAQSKQRQTDCRSKETGGAMTP